MRVVVSGASGLIGRSLVSSLRADGHEVVRLVRRPAASADEVRWDPATGALDPRELGPVDAAVNLNGAGVGDKRWSNTYKQVLRDSRVLATRTLVSALCALDDSPAVLVNGSAIGYYGDTGESAVDESASRGQGFLAELCEEWEAEAAPAEQAGMRVVLARTGLVVSGEGGAWKRLIPLFKAGLGGPMGSGRQYWSFISLADEVAALRFCVTENSIQGPVNLTAPEPLRNKEMATTMGRVLGRPSVIPAPAFALRAALGEFSTEVLGSQRIVPGRLRSAGFEFQHPDFASAFSAALAR